jgi:hypothetical protein
MVEFLDEGAEIFDYQNLITGVSGPLEKASEVKIFLSSGTL